MKRVKIAGDVIGMRDGVPVVTCVKKRDLLTFRCPWCGRDHWHSAGDPDDPGGERVSHCMDSVGARRKTPGAYYLKVVSQKGDEKT
jgi:hypothetical protein